MARLWEYNKITEREQTRERLDPIIYSVSVHKNKIYDYTFYTISEMQRKEITIMKTGNFKIAAILMAAVMACSLTACTENVENDNIQNNENTVSAPINTEAGNTEGEKDAPEESKAPEEIGTPEESKTPEETAAAENGGAAADKGQPDSADKSESSDSKNDVQFSSNAIPLTSETGKGEAIAKLAAEQTRVMYKFACAAPDKGFDNSGLMYYALTENGISCPRLTCDIAQLGSKIKYDQLQVGDLAFFEYDDDGSVIVYGGVYLGEGKMVVSMSEGIPVKVVDITTQYYRSNFVWGVCVAR